MGLERGCDRFCDFPPEPTVECPTPFSIPRAASEYSERGTECPDPAAEVPRRTDFDNAAFDTSDLAGGVVALSVFGKRKGISRAWVGLRCHHCCHHGVESACLLCVSHPADIVRCGRSGVGDLAGASSTPVG